MKRTEFEKIIAENGLFFSYEGGAGDFVTVRNKLIQDVAIISETSVAHPYWLDLSLAGKANIPKTAYQAIKAYAATEPKDRETKWLTLKVDADKFHKMIMSYDCVDDATNSIRFINASGVNLLHYMLSEFDTQRIEDDAND